MKYSVQKTDVLIIGGGATAYVAAYHLPKDSDVTMLRMGHGASPYITAFNVPVFGDDSTETYIEDSLKSGRRQNDPALVKALCEGSTEIIPFLSGLSFPFDTIDGVYKSRKTLGSSYPRAIGHANDSGLLVIQLIEEVLINRKNYHLISGTRAIKLFKTGDRICGVLAYDTLSDSFYIYQAKSVIIACGGFCRLYEFTTNTGDIAGDAVGMAYELGLPLVDMEFVQFEPSGAVWPEPIKGDGMITTLFYDGAVMKNAKNERFLFKYDNRGEKINKDELSKYIYLEVSNGIKTPHGGVWFDCTSVDSDTIHGSYEMFYQRYIKYGIDITKEPVEVYPAAHTALGGIKIKADCSTAVDGLYACGESVGGLHGSNRLGGSAGSETLVFGMIAGRSVTEFLKSHSDDFDYDFDSDINSLDMEGDSLSEKDSEALMNRAKRIFSESFNVIRDGRQMAIASSELKIIYERIASSGTNHDSKLIFRKIRNLNDLTTMRIVACSAMERPENSGCHCRSDAILDKDNNRYQINVFKSEIGTMEVDKHPL